MIMEQNASNLRDSYGIYASVNVVIGNIGREFSIETLFTALRNYRIVVIGPTNPSPDVKHASFNTKHDTDPTKRWNHVGVHECDANDDSQYFGYWHVHDTKTIRELICLLKDDESRQTATLYWLNLISARDLGKGSSNYDYSGDNHPPANMGLNISGITDVFSHDHPRTNGWKGFTTATRAHLVQTQRLLDDLMQYLSDNNIEFAVTCSRPLAHGEHGIVGTHAPTAACCETFWCSTKPNTCRLTWLDCVNAFIQDSDNHSDTVTISSVHPAFFRVVLTMNDRRYACVCDGEGQLLLLFDTNTDPYELKNILPNMRHRWEHLRNKCNEYIHRHPRRQDINTTAMMQTRQAPPKSPHVTTNRQTVKKQQIPSIVSQVSQSIRKQESLLNMRHR